jgi:3-oxosteroid 1-dehydrogenase
MTDWEHTTDFVIIGSGAGGLCAALAVRALGAESLVIEKQATIGGNSGLSGGTMWIPGNPLMRQDGISDSAEEALAYLNACVGDAGPATSEARKLKYLSEGLRMIDFLRGLGISMNRVKDYADYYAELPGGNLHGRALQCDIFDLSELGPYAERVLNPSPFIAYVEEVPQLTMGLRTWRGFATLVRVIARTAWARARRRPLAANGAALIGRLLQAGLRSGIDLWTESPVKDIVVEDDRVAGVRALRQGREVMIRARRGVLIASGGYAHNLEMRKRHGRQPASVEWTLANPGETGEVIQTAMGLGAATDLMDEAIWMPMSISPSGPMYIVYERGQPYAIMVDGEGRRYIDEGSPYMTVGQAMYERHQHTPSIPSWLILDSRHRRRYPFGMQPPGHTPKEWFRSGFMKRSDSIKELAGLCGVDPHTLEETVRRFNHFAETGVDEDFHRGETVFSRQFGDPRHGPNPVLGAIDRPPFYAVAVYPGDLGTFGGILTDEHARVIRDDGSVIDGLYATGNATAPVMGRSYPCTGASIASTMIWGFVAAQHALGQLPTKASSVMTVG